MKKKYQLNNLIFLLTADAENPARQFVEDPQYQKMLGGTWLLVRSGFFARSSLLKNYFSYRDDERAQIERDIAGALAMKRDGSIKIDDILSLCAVTSLIFMEKDPSLWLNRLFSEMFVFQADRTTILCVDEKIFNHIPVIYLKQTLHVMSELSEKPIDDTLRDQVLKAVIAFSQYINNRPTP